MIRTIVGYSGGLSPSPNYRAIADHTETIEIVYDSGKISYGRLLEEFWKGHDPTQGGGARQYRSVILVAGEGQRRLAMQSRDAESARLGKPVRTAIEPLQFLWPAEEYHQKYYLQGRKDLFGAFRKALGAESGWYMTSSAARLNAFVAGEIDADSLMRDLGSFDLPAGFTDNLAPLLPGK